MAGDLVTVTGGSGFLASWIILGLLERGFRVRSTVRSATREASARAALSAAAAAGSQLEFVHADLLADGGWDEAVRGARFVIHPASPMQIGEYAQSDVVRPAREGVRRILRASRIAGVEHVVVTSSVVACTPSSPGKVGSEEVWTDVTRQGVSDYVRAKTLAERDLWDWAQQNATPSVTTVLPGFIQGPVLSADYSGSVELVARLLRGQVPMAPRLGFPIIDVRDLAALHIAAMTEAKARGRRLIAAGDFLWILEIARILKEGFPDRAAKLPSKEIPNLIVRIMALVNPEMRQLVPDLGKKTQYDSAKVGHLLDWSMRPVKETLLDGAQSLLRLGVSRRDAAAA